MNMHKVSAQSTAISLHQVHKNLHSLSPLLGGEGVCAVCKDLVHRGIR